MRKRRWEIDSKMYVRGIRREGMDCIHLIQDRDKRRACANTVLKCLG